MGVVVLGEGEIRACVGVDEAALAVVEDGFTRLAQGKATMPPIMRIDIPQNNGEVDIKSAYLQGLDSFAVKMSSGFFDNYRLGLPSLSGMMVLLSAKTGLVEAILLDNGYLTDVRTAAAGALAAKYLAPRRVTTVGIVGAGAQARYQIRALRLVRDFERVLVFSRTATSVARYVEEMSGELGGEVAAAADLASLVQASQIVVTTTPARAPLIKAAWLHSGLHITAMGADAEAKQELEAAVLGRADMLVCDRTSQAFRLGELHHGLEAGVISPESPIVELGDITAGYTSGRQHEDQITICDLTGTGVQDTAIANLAYRKAKEAGVGLEIGD